MKSKIKYFIVVFFVFFQMSFSQDTIGEYRDSSEKGFGDVKASQDSFEVISDDDLMAAIQSIQMGDTKDLNTEGVSDIINNRNSVNISLSGYNLLRTLYGYKAVHYKSFFYTQDSVVDLKQDDLKLIKPNPYFCVPWYYLTNNFNFTLDISKFSLSARIKIDEPSMGVIDGDNGAYQELLDKRTLSYENDNLSIFVGHFATTFGRGLTLSLSENETIGKTNLLDGLHIKTDLGYLSLQAFAGRDKEEQYFDYYTNNATTIGWDDSAHIPNKLDKSTIYGIHGESYVFSYIPFLEFLSASSIGGGIINFRSKVKDESSSESQMIIDSSGTANDTTIISNRYSFYQDKINSIVPSGFLNLSFGHVSLYAEYAKLLGRNYGTTKNGTQYISDTLIKSKGFNFYSTLGLDIGKFYVLLEGVNYWYLQEMSNIIAYQGINKYIDAPKNRHKHKWHLLNKISAPARGDDQIGYNLECNFNASDNSSLTYAFSQNGVHNDASLFASDLDNWEHYGEINLHIKNNMSISAALQYGQSEWGRDDKEILTACLQTEIKPINDKHVFGFDFEFQNKKVDYTWINTSLLGIKDSVQRYLVEINAGINVDDLSLEDIKSFAIGDCGYNKDSKSSHDEVNFLVVLSYTFSSVFSCRLQFEKEQRFLLSHLHLNDRPKFFLKSDIASETQYYKSIVFNVSPNEKLDFELGIGSFSERDECSASGCTILPAVKGVRFKLNTVF